MTEHTPGPWHIQSVNTLIKSKDRKKTIAFVCFSSRGMDSDIIGEEHKANARLIAAAPDLLEELQYAIDVSTEGLSLGEKWQESARAAIAKAKGGK